MGIKGIYREIGPGERVSLCKLAVEKLEQTRRPFRLAVDISIWQFQVQAARGGANPAIRTLFYRLVRLLGLSVEPIFVFDGPKKPAFKRNKRSGRGDGVATAMAKRLIKLFGFQVHDAPGEAEAECALLQQQGIVDAVLSEDVDTIMFGCTRTLRNWSADGSKGSKAPTHVSMYESDGLRQSQSGLDREGMVLVALMSGGDYLPEGVPGCGVKVACEAARAGFGRSLCQLKKSDSPALKAWRENLVHELQTNESGFFRTKHKALNIPETFPNLEVLRYYTHPVVSPLSTIEHMKQAKPSAEKVDVLGLRAFVGETFDWIDMIGAVKFIRVLAPSLLVQKMLASGNQDSQTNLTTDNPDDTLREESRLVRAISNRRTHYTTDGTPELRVSYTPLEVVEVDLSTEEEEASVAYGREGLALNSDDEFEEQPEGTSVGTGPKKVFDPSQPDLIWLPESIVKLGAPLTVEDWEEKQRSKEPSRLAKSPKRKAKKADMRPGALDGWVHVTKGMSSTKRGTAGALLPSQPALPLPPFMASQSATAQQVRLSSTKGARARPAAGITSKQSKPKGSNAASQPNAPTNPWTIASSQASPRITKSFKSSEAIIISSSPVPAPSSPTRSPLKHIGSPPPENTFISDPEGSPTLSPRKHRSRPNTRRTTPTKTLVGQSRRTQEKAKDTLTLSQMSIKNYGMLTKTGREPLKSAEHRSHALSKPQSHKAEDPFESDSDEFGDIEKVFARRKEANNDSIPPVGASVAPPIDTGASTEKSGKEADAGGSATTKLYIPRTSDTGFFKVIEVPRKEADTAIREHSRPKEPGGPARPKIWRQSEVSLIDLTAED